MDGDLPESVQAVAQDSVARLREVYRLSATAAQGGTRLLIEVAETAWGSARLLNDRVVRNVDTNTAAAFDAGRAP